MEAEPHPRARPETTPGLQPLFLLPGVSGPSRCTMELALPAILFTVFPGVFLGSEVLTTDSYSLSTKKTDRSSIDLDSGKVGDGKREL